MLRRLSQKFHDFQNRLPPTDNICACHSTSPPPFTEEIHGLGQAFASETLAAKLFWWSVVAICVALGTTMTIFVTLEYIDGPTASSTSINIVNALEFPSLTVCPKVADAFNQTAITNDILQYLPDLQKNEILDLIKFFVGGNGMENIDGLADFNRTYIDQLSEWYSSWSRGYANKDFFFLINDRFGYKCEDLFFECHIGSRKVDCCHDIFTKTFVMRRGACFKTRRGVNQTDPDDIGRLQLSIKSPPSITTASSKYVQSQIIAYVTDNYDLTMDFPRFYLLPNEWNRLRLDARHLHLIENPEVCTNSIIGKNTACYVRKWLLSNILMPYNCTLSYMDELVEVPPHNGICDVRLIALNYESSVDMITLSEKLTEQCIPGCERWEYTSYMQSSKALEDFADYSFNLEISFSAIQYEHVQEVYTTTIPGFMAQIGGQFGFFLGLSIITFIQIALYTIKMIVVSVIWMIRILYLHSKYNLKEFAKQVKAKELDKTGTSKSSWAYTNSTMYIDAYASSISEEIIDSIGAHPTDIIRRRTLTDVPEKSTAILTPTT